MTDLSNICVTDEEIIFYRNSLKKADEYITSEKQTKKKALKDIVGIAFENHRKRIWKNFGFNVSKEKYCATFNVDWSITYKGKLIAIEEDKGHYVDSCFLERALTGFANTISNSIKEKRLPPILILHSFTKYSKFSEKLETFKEILKPEIIEHISKIQYIFLTDRDRLKAKDWHGSKNSECNKSYELFSKEELIIKDIKFIKSLIPIQINSNIKHIKENKPNIIMKREITKEYMKEKKIYLKHGDCLDIMEEIDNKSIDLILCDLPYGITKNKWDVIIPFDKLWKHYNRIIKDNGAIILFGSQPFTTRMISSNEKYFRYCLVWEKNKFSDFLNSKRKPMKTNEDICIFYKKQPTYNIQYWYSTPYKRWNTQKAVDKQSNYGLHKENVAQSDGKRLPTTVLKFNRVERPKHPTQKPVDLLEWLIKSYSNEGETVLDNCMGIGSTGRACKNINRNFIGIELDEKYFNQASEYILTQQSSIDNNDSNNMTI